MCRCPHHQHYLAEKGRHNLVLRATNAPRVAQEVLRWKGDQTRGLLSTARVEEADSAREVERPHTLAKAEVPKDIRRQLAVSAHRLAS